MPTQPYVSTVIPGCRWDFRRFLRAQRAYRRAEAYRIDIGATLVANGFTLRWAEQNDSTYRGALLDENNKFADAEARRQTLLDCLTNMDRPDVIGDPAAYINSRPETSEPASIPGTNQPNPVLLPPGVTEAMDEADYVPPALAERCGAPSKNFKRYGYCDRLASKDGNYCYSHA